MNGYRIEPGGVRFLNLPETVEAVVADGRELPVDGAAAFVPGAAAGTRYQFRTRSGRLLPDPRTRFQPDGVHGPSEVIDPDAYAWQNNGWTGRPLDELVVYELHVGTFTDAGTFAAGIEVLDELVALGVTAVELMPVSPAPGRWGWGYDGVSLFAVKEQYGRPDDFKAFVDAAHERGLCVILDVVYNHFGPEGNYLAEFGDYFDKSVQTPWGAALNFAGPARRYVVENARMWLEEYRVDGLRLDAVQFMYDATDPPVTADIARAAREVETATGRRKLLFGETNVYDHDLLRPLEEGGSGFDAVWCDDFLYATHHLLTGEQRIVRQFDGPADLPDILRQGAIYDGPPGGRTRLMPDRVRKITGGERLDLSRLVWSIQNHDLVGNDPHGRRMTEHASPEAHRAAAALMLLYPAVPLLFMGEEFASRTPFHFFTDFGDEHLREAVVAGKRQEYAAFDWDDLICPTSADAFARSRRGRQKDGDAAMVAWYADLIALRKRWRGLSLLTGDVMTVDVDPATDIYRIGYAGECGVVVRLTPNGKTHADLSVGLPGEAVLSSVPCDGRSATLGRHDAVAWERRANATAS